jgi:hypothetical protein
MAWQYPRGGFAKGALLPGSPIAKSVESRAREIGGLLQTRRKIALAFKRTGSETHRAELREMDNILAKHRIDLPAIAGRLAARKS